MVKGMKNPDRELVKTSTILIYCSIILTVFVYYGSAEFYQRIFTGGDELKSQYYYFLSSFVWLGIVPLLIWKLGFGSSLREMGLSFGNTKQTLVFSAIGLPVIIIMAYFTAQNPAFRAEYPLFRGLLDNHHLGLGYWLMYALYYIGWEFFFRGFMLFGLKNKFGETSSILIQTIPSCLVHIGKPDAEIFSSIFAGIIFGYVALRCRSLWPVFIWHLALGVVLDIFIVFG